MSQDCRTHLIRHPTQTAQRERRAWVRYPSGEFGSCVLECATELGWWGRIIDVSHGGIAIILPRRLRAGTVLLMDQPGQEGKPVRPLRLRVVHTTTNPGGGWLLGCRFASPLSERELRAFLDSEESRMPTRPARVAGPAAINLPD
jgi:hypothetical protein